MAEAGMIGTKLFLGNTTGDNPVPLGRRGAGRLRDPRRARPALFDPCGELADPVLAAEQDEGGGAHRPAGASGRAHRCRGRRGAEPRRDAGRLDRRAHPYRARKLRGSIPFIRFWKERGCDITVETLPQYLYLDAESFAAPGGHLMRMNPPIRQKSHQEPLWQALLDGTIDFVATDHAPHAVEEKEGETIWDMACGFPGVQTSLTLMLQAVHAGRMTLPEVVRVMSGAPARTFGLSDRKGAIAPGMDADLVVVDMERRKRWGPNGSCRGARCRSTRGGRSPACRS
jgi:dihydroorotase